VNMSTVLVNTATIGVAAALHAHIALFVSFVPYVIYMYMLLKKEPVI